MNAYNGNFLWKLPASFRVESSPTVANGIVYIGLPGFSASNFYALNGTNGAVIWNCTTGGEISTAPAVSGGAVYICGDVNDYLYALNATSGLQLWNYTIGFSGSLAVANGIVYAGCCDSAFCALNATDGTLIWNFTDNPSGYGTMAASFSAVADGVVYVGPSDGKLYALNATNGKTIWSFQTQLVWNNYTYAIGGSPAAVGNVVYFGAGNGCLYALNTTTGLQLWNFTMPRFVGNGWAIESGPAVDNGEVFQGSFYGCLYAFGNSPAPTPAPTPTPTPSQTTTATPTQTPSATAKPTPTASPTPAATPNSTSNIKTVNITGTDFVLTFGGNVTSLQVSNAALSTDQKTTEVSFSLTGQSGTEGFCNVTIPKNAVSGWSVPIVYVDNQKCENQGCTQDTNNYYAWFTTHFSTHNVSIVFSEKTQNLDVSWLTIVLAAVVISPVIVLVAVLGNKWKTKKEATQRRAN